MLRTFLIPLLLFFWFFPQSAFGLQIGRPLRTEILNLQDQAIAKALIYIDYFEVLSMNSRPLGKVGIVNLHGNLELFLVKENSEKALVGWAADKHLYNGDGELVGFYDWTTYWVYAYSVTGQPLGKAKCIAFRGYCAAGVAAFLTGLFSELK